MSNEEPSRIILPGGAKPGGLVGPDGRPLSSAPPAADDLPTHPRLRPVEIEEAREGGRTLLVLVDPSGIAPQALAIAAEAMPVLLLLDGSVALDDLIEMIVRETGDVRAGDSVKTLVKELDQRLFLESPRYVAARDKARAAYRAEPTRPAALAGLSYPEERAELEKFLAGFADGAIAPTNPGALAAPHIDLRRGGAVMVQAYQQLGDAPDVAFVFGTGHGMLEEPFAVTAKPFETPLGTVDADADVVSALERACGPSLSAEEMAHRDEHSIEFQAVLLKHRYPNAPLKIVPLLCGGFHGLVRYERKPTEEPRVETLAAALIAEADRLRKSGRKVLFVAGVDLSHVGARFGDAIDLDEATLRDIEKKDKEAIDAALTGDAGAWFDAIAAHGDSTRICGFAPMYMMLRAARPGAGRLLAYEQSLEESGSVVTFASLAWP